MGQHMKGPHNWHAKLGVLLLHLALLWAVSQFQSPQWIRPAKASIAVTLLSADTHTFAPVAPVATFASAAEQALKAPTTTQAVTPNQPKPASEAIAAGPVNFVVSASVAAPSVTSGSPLGPRPTRLELPSAEADYLNNPAPIYPRMSKRLAEQGTVIVRVLITPEGLAGQAEVIKSSGFERLDQAALDAVRNWRFVPGRRMGVAEAMWFNVPVRFVLNA
jgi:protein TonB